MTIGIRTLTYLWFGGSVLAAGLAFAQTKPAFEVASISPAAPLDMAKIMAAVQAGESPKIAPHVDAERAEYTYMALRDLIALAYGVKPYQVSGPDWLANQRFDIMAKLAAGASKDDAPGMLQTLLADRFGLVIHRSNAEHPVLALLAGKGAPKLKASVGTPMPLDENAPTNAGDIKMNTPDGPVRMSPGKDGTTTVNMGLQGTMKYRTVPGTQSMHMDGDMVSMAGFASMQVSLDISISDIMNMARAAGTDVLVPGGAVPAPASGVASDPGGMSFAESIQSLGLRLEQRKAVVEQLIVDHMEKSPTEN